MQQMNQLYACVNQPYAKLMHALALCEVFGVHLHKNNVLTLLLHFLSIVSSDWLHSVVLVVYE